ncbi:MAG: hypothetical protein M3282_11440 [Gemmatimonadota bacterium]|nr:hypothetical protein [Gemmatimonadota bacterium]
MTAARARLIGDAIVVAAMLGVAPLARVDAQAAMISMPKEAAQRAAAASNAQLQAQVSQVQTPAAAPQSGQPQGAARRGAGATPGVVQSGAPAIGAGAITGAGAMPGAGATRDPANAIMREVFDYGIQGRRDPFFSLLSTGDLRPMLSDLRLTTILYDLSGRRPVAVMNDVSTNLQYRVTTGMMLGRMRVTQIRPRKVIFAIEEFGFSRTDSLVLADKPQTRQ